MEKQNTFMYHIRRNIDLIIIFILGFVPLLWFREGCVIAGGDFTSFLNSIRFSSNYLNTWATAGVGSQNITMPIATTHYIFFSGMKMFGISNIAAQKIWFVLLFTLTGLSMRYLVRTVMGQRDGRAAVMCLVSASLYMINFFVVNTKQYCVGSVTIYACTPLFLGLVYRMVKATHGNLAYALTAALVTVVCMSAAPNVPVLAVNILIIVVFIVFIFCFTIGIRSYGRGLLCIGIFVLMSFCLNAWWIIPWVKLLFSYKGYESYRLIYWNPGSTFTQSFILGGSWAWGDNYYPISYPVYQHMLMKYVLYLVPVLGFAAMLVIDRTKKLAWFFVLISFVGIFLSKGRGGLWGWFYVRLFETMPGFWMFREPYTKFCVMTVLGYSFLAGLFVQWAYDELKRMRGKKYFSMPAIALCIIFAAGWPLFSRYFIEQTDDVGYRSMQARIPSYWTEAASYLDNQRDDARLFEMPENKSGYTTLGWEQGFSGGVPEQSIFCKPVVTSSFFVPAVIQYYYYMMRDFRYGIGSKLFSLLNARYIYQRNDLVWQYLNTSPPGHVKQLLERKLGLRKEASFGSLDVYGIGNAIGVLYLKDSLDIVIGGFQTIPVMTYTDHMNFPSLFFWGQLPDEESVKALQHGQRVLFYQSDPEDFVMRLLPETCKVQPERLLAWRDYDYRKGWCAVNNFYYGEWVGEAEQQFVNDDFFENFGSVFTKGTAPLEFTATAHEEGVCWVALKAFSSQKEGQITLQLDDQPMRYDIAGDRPRMRWFAKKRQLAKGDHRFLLSSDGERALVDAIALFTDSELAQSVMKAEELFKNKELSYFFVCAPDMPRTMAFRVFREGTYEISSRSLTERRGIPERVQVTFDNEVVECEAGKDFRMISTINLSKGEHRLAINRNAAGILLKIAFRPEKQAEYKQVAWRRYGPTRIVAGPLEINKPMVLVFNESFHHGWKAYKIPEPTAFHAGVESLMNLTLSRTGFEELPGHFMVNGYANAFYLPRPGVYTILLEFEPQNDLEKGFLVSFISVIICGLCLLLCVRSNMNRVD